MAKTKKTAKKTKTKRPRVAAKTKTKPRVAAKKKTAKPKTKPAKQRASAPSTSPCPPPSSSAYPYVHVGHGISAARKTWTIAVVLRDAADKRALGSIERPDPLDGIAVGGHGFTVGHDSDSLQWVVAAAYPGPGTRADKGEATGEQWQAFNADVDAYLARVHERFPIACVIRTVDDEYSTELSAWHAWSCLELPRILPFVASVLDEHWYLEHALDLWRGWFADHTLAEQQALVAALDADARAIFDEHGGVPEPAERETFDEPPSLAEMKAAWAALPADANPLEAFPAAFSHLHFENGGKVDLMVFFYDLADEPTPEQDALAVDIARRALAAPGCQWPDTHWRPGLVDALVRLGRFDEARHELGRVVAAATSYLDGSWHAMVGYLDARGRREDGDVIFRLADRYVAAWSDERKGAAKANKHRAAEVLLELAQPALADLDALDDETLSHFAFLFEDLVNDKVAGDAVLPEAKRMRAEYNARRERRIADGNAKLARGEPLDQVTLKDLIDQTQRAVATARPDDVARLAKAALAFPALVMQLESLGYYARDANPAAALVVYRAVMDSEPPAEGLPRKSWLQTANAALITTHAQKLYEESAALADRVTKYVRENPYITHSAACSYAAAGRYDDAFEQARLAVELGYDHVDKVRVDKDLGPLLDRADFKALFKAKR